MRHHRTNTNGLLYLCLTGSPPPPPTAVGDALYSVSRGFAGAQVWGSEVYRS
jgi:hypothetical protein